MNPMSPLGTQTLPDANTFFREGRLDEALEAQKQAVKLDPACNEKRLFLFELLTFAGDLQRAELQIEAVNYADTEADVELQPYHNLIAAERIRERVFQGLAKPQFMQEPPEHVRCRLRALRMLSAGDREQALGQIGQANQQCASAAGEINGEKADAVRDCDDVLGPVLEAMCGFGTYMWLPMSQIDSLTLAPPKAPRDLIWAKGFVEMKGGTSGTVYLPTLYAASSHNADSMVRLGRKTEWLTEQPAEDAESKAIRGQGLRTFRVGDNALTMLDLHEVHFA